MKKTRRDLKPGTVFRYVSPSGKRSLTFAADNLLLEGSPTAYSREIVPILHQEVVVEWEPGDAAKSDVKQDLNRQFYDGKTAEECLAMFERRMQIRDTAIPQAVDRVVRMTALQLSVGRNEWRRVLAEKVKATDAERAHKERDQVRVDLMFEEWE